jgi:hypothetical protein
MSVIVTWADGTDPKVAVIVALPGVTEVTTPVGSTTATFVFDDTNTTPERIGVVLASVRVAVTVSACVLPVPLSVTVAGDRAMLVTDLTENASVDCAIFPAPSVATALNWCSPLARDVVSRLAW